MLVNPKAIATFALLGLLLAVLSKVESVSHRPLPSLRNNPSEWYTPDFYPNGSYVELPMGTLRYWLFGNPEGKRVVLIHGISTGSAMYDKLARHLADSGHHVLVFDLWGRGYSDAPAMPYDESLYTTQVALLFQKVSWSSADVVGTSLGGGIAVSFTAFYPELVNKLVLVAPAGLMEEKDIPITGKLVKFPLVSRIALHPWLRPLVLSGVTRFYNHSRIDKKDTEDAMKIAKIAFYQFAHHPGFTRAFLRTVMDFPLAGLDERYERVGKRDPDRQILVIWGDKDQTVPFRHHTLLQKHMPQATISRYEGAGHDVLLTHWPQVGENIAQFLS